MMLSNKLRVAIKLSSVRQYRLAQSINTHPSLLSHWLNGIVEPKPGDPRIVESGRLVDVAPDECFAIRKGGGGGGVVIWMKISKGAKYADSSPKVLYSAARAGKLRVAKIGAGRNMITCDTWIDQWLQAAADEATERGQ